MSLSADQIAEILESLSSAPLAQGGDARRASRMKLMARLRITPCQSASSKSSQTITVQIENIGARGIGLLHSNPLPSGSQFVLHLGAKEGKSVNLLCTVQHCKQVRPDRYRIGAEITCPIASLNSVNDEEELKRISQSILD